MFFIVVSPLNLPWFFCYLSRLPVSGRFLILWLYCTFRELHDWLQAFGQKKMGVAVFENNANEQAHPFRSKTAQNACFPGFPGRAAARTGASGRKKAPRLRREARDFLMRLVNCMLIVTLNAVFGASHPMM
jgi:hypothetical protein